MEQRKRRIRSRATPVSQRQALAALKEKLVAAGDAQRALAVAANAAQEALAEFTQALKQAKLTEYTDGQWQGTLTRSAGRSTRYIDPAAFRKLVKDDKEFYSAISVSVTEACKVVPGKTLDKITTTTPGTPGPEKVTVTEVKGK